LTAILRELNEQISVQKETTVKTVTRRGYKRIPNLHGDNKSNKTEDRETTQNDVVQKKERRERQMEIKA
jgi:DNA-binding winged helix-turn-helix (wHTH) protein